jgi:shikimate kinase
VARIWLIGMMGSGKTTVAPLVAARLGWQAADTDAAIERHHGRRVAEWLTEDPAGFRAAERTVVVTLAGAPVDLVVACGGGVGADPEAVAVMQANGFVVYLEAAAPVLLRRVGSAAGRPLLEEDPVAAVGSLLAERRERYRLAAHAVVPADGSPETVAAMVVTAWQNWS